MKCPACDRALKQKEAGRITVDVCEGGCGGIWFDWFELQRVDEPDEHAGEELLEIPRDAGLIVGEERRRHCPRCGGIPMMRHFFGVKREVEVDECPQCAGFWLDAGELGRIRDVYPSEEEARAAARELFTRIIDEELGPQREESEEKLRKARRFAHMFRFICPSYYIPGKQRGGAF